MKVYVHIEFNCRYLEHLKSATCSANVSASQCLNQHEHKVGTQALTTITYNIKPFLIEELFNVYQIRR